MVASVTFINTQYISAFSLLNAVIVTETHLNKLNKSRNLLDRYSDIFRSLRRVGFP